MKVVNALLLGCGALVGVAAITGAFTLDRVHTVDVSLSHDIALDLAAADYERGAAKIRLAAEMRALGAVGSDALRREGQHLMADSRKILAASATDPAVRAQLAEMERVEALTVGATSTLFTSEGTAANVDPRIAQQLNFVQARAEALTIGLETFAERRREHVERSLQSMSAMEVVVGGAIVGSVVLALIVAVVLARRISAPIKKLSRGVRELGAGNFDHVIDLQSRDEMAEFARGFNEMTSNLRGTMGRLAKRNQDMSLVLDNVTQGFITIDLEGVMASEHSAVVDRWFGKPTPGATLAEYLGARGGDFGAWLSMGLEGLKDGFMPTELLIEQLPHRLNVGDMAFQVDYTPLSTNDAVTGLLVIVRDVTDELKRAANDRAQRETLALFQRISADRAGVEDFVTEASNIIRALETEGDPAVQKRHVHTLKGNAATYGLEEFASACHELENQLASPDHGPEMTEAEKQSLIATWQVASDRIATLLGDGRRDKVEISEEELVRVIQRAKGGASASALASELAMWKLEPVERRLERLGRQAQSLAVRLGKPEVEIAVDGGGIRIDPASWGGVWASMMHVVRNAIDHGIEAESERLAAAKQAAGQLKLSAHRVEGDLLIEIRDDGRGVDWAAVHARAERLGIPHTTQQELVDALFTDGLSTRDEATDTSGRGVGLSALRSVVTDLGGAVEVDTSPGRGTTFRLRLPERRVRPKTQQILRMTS